MRPKGLAILVEDDEGKLYIMRTRTVRHIELQCRREFSLFGGYTEYHLEADFNDFEIIANDYFHEEENRPSQPALEDHSRKYDIVRLD